jgi:adenylate cyclase
MKFAIERKFLLKNDGWKAAIASARTLTDGLLSSLNGSNVRIRVTDDKGSITIKGPMAGLSRAELEYEIPLGRAEHMLSNLCGSVVCNKTRYTVPHDKHVWYIDVYENLLEGFVTADIELTLPNESFALPDWIGQEVTGDPGYGKWATLSRNVTLNDSNDKVGSNGRS